MNKPVYFGLSILELNKMLMREFGYNYVKPKYDEKPKSYRQRASLTVSILTVSLYTWNQMIFTKILQEDVETRFDTSNYELDRQLPKWKNEKVIELIKDELVGKSKIKFVGLKAKR